MKLSLRDEALLEYLMANTNIIPMSEQSQAVIDYNVMMGNIDDPTIEENEEAK